MKPFYKGIIVVALCMIIPLLSHAQEEAPAEAPPAAEAGPPGPAVKPPIMRSVFWNTVWGSAWGALMGTVAALSSPDVPFRDSLILGTTAGGIVGYGFGILLVIRGISFDSSNLPQLPTTPLGAYHSPFQGTQYSWATIPPPMSEESRMQQEFATQGWKTVIFETKF